MVDATRVRAGKRDDLAGRIERLESLLQGAGPAATAAAALRAAANPVRQATATDLEKRINELERRLLKIGNGDGAYEPEQEPEQETARLGYCAVPPTQPRTFGPEVSLDRQGLIQVISKKWVDGTKLRYCFLGGTSAGGDEQKDFVRRGFDVWKNIGIGIRFEEVKDPGSAEVRIGFVQGDGAWSYIGRDVIDVAGQNERTMNFGWDLRTDPRGVDVPVHEIGHTLGFPHEHQNPFSGIVWDEEAVYRYFGGPPNNWTHQVTEYNILRKLSTSEVQGTQWDPDSIMHYAFEPGLIQEPDQYRQGLRPHGGLSPHDLSQAKVFYPALEDSGNPELKPFGSQSLRLNPAQQANFNISPPASRTYTLRTFGGADTVMVLFEDVNGDLRYVDGDDDSGTDRNAEIRTRLVSGRRYVLRIRLYSSFDSGEFAVMMW